jgi:5-methylcytosine-specific restriction endonuclease McrA
MANREKIMAQQAARRDPAIANARFRAWYAENREAQVQRALAWAKANPERRRATQQRRIARQKNAAGADYTTTELIAARVDFYGGRCYYCGAEPAETVDHRKPLARGGSHWPANLVPACGSCNYRKGTKTEQEFLAA